MVHLFSPASVLAEIIHSSTLLSTKVSNRKVGNKMGFQITCQQPVELLSQYALYYTITINNLHCSQPILSTVTYNSNQWSIKVKSQNFGTLVEFHFEPLR